MLRDQCIATHYGKPPRSTKAVVHTVHDIAHLDAVSSAIFRDEVQDKPPHEWTKPARNTTKEVTESYMIEVIAESHL